MKYCINEDSLKKADLSLNNLLMLLLLRSGENPNWAISVLMEKNLVMKIKDRYIVSEQGNTICDTFFTPMASALPSEEELAPLADRLIEVFPKGKKPGTPYQWRCSRREIILKLKSFYRKYGVKYTEDEIVEAARKYVDSFNGDYRFMRLLKYFIWKKDEDVEISELAATLENAGQEDETDESWINELK